MIALLLTLASISGGILLGLATLDKWDGESNFFNKMANALAPFQTLIGVVLLILALLTFRSNFLYSVIRIMGGLLLLTHVFSKVPALEDVLLKISMTLMPFKAVIGIALIVLGILSLF